MNDQRDAEMDQFLANIWKNRQMLGTPYQNLPNIYLFPYGSVVKMNNVPQKVMHHASKGTDGMLLVIQTPSGHLYYVPADEWNKSAPQAPQQQMPVPQMQANAIRTRKA